MRPSGVKVRVKLVLGDAIAIIDHCDGDSIVSVMKRISFQNDPLNNCTIAADNVNCAGSAVSRVLTQMGRRGAFTFLTTSILFATYFMSF